MINKKKVVQRVNSLYILDNEFPKSNLEMEKEEITKKSPSFCTKWQNSAQKISKTATYSEFLKTNINLFL